MKRFNTKEELAAAYAEYRLDQKMLRLNIEGHKQLDKPEIINDREVFRGVAEQTMIYNPLYYRGGYVLPGFGYSAERIGKYVTEEQAGDPEAVERKAG